MMLNCIKKGITIKKENTHASMNIPVFSHDRSAERKRTEQFLLNYIL